MISSILFFIFGVIIAILLAVIIILLAFPFPKDRNKIVKNEKNTVTKEIDETAHWVNHILKNVLKGIDISTHLPTILQKSFNEQYKPDPKNTIQRISVVEASMSSKPPIFQDVHTIDGEDGTATSTLGIKYDSEIVIDLDIECLIPMLGVKTIGAIAKVTKIDGFADVSVPYEYGPIVIKFRNGTQIDIDVAMRFGQTAIGTANLGFVWKGIQKLVVAMLKQMPYRIEFPFEKYAATTAEEEEEEKHEEPKEEEKEENAEDVSASKDDKDASDKSDENEADSDKEESNKSEENEAKSEEESKKSDENDTNSDKEESNKSEEESKKSDESASKSSDDKSDDEESNKSEEVTERSVSIDPAEGVVPDDTTSNKSKISATASLLGSILQLDADDLDENGEEDDEVVYDEVKSTENTLDVAATQVKVTSTEVTTVTTNEVSTATASVSVHTTVEQKEDGTVHTTEEKNVNASIEHSKDTTIQKENYTKVEEIK
ncbi:hypothetical protein GPJ56_010420 [Histomonas meleagridis]|uniref:uncharacterized protein n=1 Tax=Histomonas meleagridis TaxID=135588 RepID=UPI0035593F0F|nr:hypothetical protein GPJ56_010420 [Histomonas meleagridis]KAH0799021.1 hypothetical protein GO595_008173 [Histomonas meleagridis]